MSRYATNHTDNRFNATNSFNFVRNNSTIADDLSQLLARLPPLEQGLPHRDIQGRRVNHVGEWLLQTREFKRWCGLDGESEGDDHNAVLFCYGDPGAGKTFISSLVVDRLCDQARGQKTDITYFYFDSAARKEQCAASTLGSLLQQMASGMERTQNEITRGLQNRMMAINEPRAQLADIMNMLQLITSSQRTFICIDALDEYPGAQQVRLLDSLNRILKKSPGTRIFVTGRPHVRAEVERRLEGRVVSVAVGPIKADIIRYLRVRLAEDKTPDAMDKSLEAEILGGIPENISGMFLPVSLNIEAILQESTTCRRRERLRELRHGFGLEATYGGTIERIKAQAEDKSRLGMAALMWVSHAERPLRVDELCHALAVELGSTDFNASNIPSISTLVECCQGLITVGKESSTVRLIHSTLHEYLSAYPAIFSRPHSAIAETCLTYLNSQQVRALSADPSPDTRGRPFLEYCSLNWGVHAKRELSVCAWSLALQLFQEYDGHISIKLLLRQPKYERFVSSGTGLRFSALDCASFFGIVEVVATLIEARCYDITKGDLGGYTPLVWAAINGHEEVVKILLELQGVDPGHPDRWGQTPLSYASQNGHEEVVKVLLEREGVNPDQSSYDGKTPLTYAAQAGHEGIVEILLGWGAVNPNKLDKCRGTPLSYAARCGHEGVVNTLLAWGEVNLDKSDGTGQTPLSYAAQCGHEGVVKILLGREELNPDKPDQTGQSPLSYAARKGHEEVVKMLLGRVEVNPDKLDIYGRTPLFHAASFGHERIVKTLLEQEEVNPDRPDDYGKTPLWSAASNGREEVVKILLGRKEVNPDKQDDEGKTPLWSAASNGREGVVKILLGRKEVNPDKQDDEGKTPLLGAAMRGHEGVVKLLLGRDEVTPNKPDDSGQTPLMTAAMGRHKRVIALLEPYEAVNQQRRVRPRRHYHLEIR